MAFRGIIWFIGLLGLALPILIVLFLIVNGWEVVDWKFVSTAPAGFPLGKGGGILPAIQGSLALALYGLTLAAPTAILSAIYVTEYCSYAWLVNIVRFTTEIMTAIPSILYGLFGYTFFVIFLDMKTSLNSGGLTLGLLMFPLIFVGTHEILSGIDPDYRTAALSLGVDKTTFIRKILLPQSLPGIVSIILLAIAHAVGTAAPVLYTAAIILSPGGIEFDLPVMTLPTHLYYLVGEAISFEHAFGTALVLVILIFLTSFVAAMFKRVVNAHAHK